MPSRDPTEWTVDLERRLRRARLGPFWIVVGSLAQLPGALFLWRSVLYARAGELGVTASDGSSPLLNFGMAALLVGLGVYCIVSGANSRRGIAQLAAMKARLQGR